jgi:hypothetical protein
MKGEFVVVRDYAKRPRVCRVCDASEKAVFVASPEEYDKRVKGFDSLDPVGFPRSDVFRYDAEVQSRLERGEIRWSELQPYDD